MKKRLTFVSNSSSCSFVVYLCKHNVDKFFESIKPLKFQELWHADNMIKYDEQKLRDYISMYEHEQPFTIYLGINDTSEFDMPLGYMVGRLLMNGIKCHGDEETEYQLKEVCQQ